MAKYYSSTFGTISGKHGSAVAVTRRDGTTYIRMHVIPHNPRTDKQQAHRSKIGLVSKSLAPFNPIFKHTMGVTNGISIARSHAFKNAIVDEYPNFSIDYEKIMFSFGTLEKLQNASIARNQSVITVNWDFNEVYNCHGNDSVSLVVFNKESNQALHIDDIALRNDMQAKIDIYEAWADSELYFWAYVRREDKISDSVFVGKCGANTPIDTDIEMPYYDDTQPSTEISVSDCSEELLQDEKDDVNDGMPASVFKNMDVRTDSDQLRTITIDQKKVLLYLLDKEKINVSDVEKLLSINQAKAYSLLRDLMSKDLIVPRGRGKGGHYVLRNIVVR